MANTPYNTPQEVREFATDMELSSIDFLDRYGDRTDDGFEVEEVRLEYINGTVHRMTFDAFAELDGFAFQLRPEKNHS